LNNEAWDAPGRVSRLRAFLRDMVGLIYSGALAFPNDADAPATK
jgi:hypothetical protein